MSRFVYLIPLLPLLGFVFNFVVGVRMLSPKPHGDGHDHGHGSGHGDIHAHGPNPLIGLVACGTVFAAFLVAVYAVLKANAAPDHTLVETLWTWLPGGAAETAL